MYGEAMDGIHNYLIRTSEANKLVYTAELIPEQHPDGQLYVLISGFPSTATNLD